MKLTVHFTPQELSPGEVAGRPVLVLDVLRASTSIVAALARGARAVIPAVTVAEARRVARARVGDSVLLAGERGGLPIEGFDLGNSPREMRQANVGGRIIVMTTTNGTPALRAAADGRPVLVAAATNFRAAADAARGAAATAGGLVVLCSGRGGRFALEDAYAAGRFTQAVLGPRRGGAALNDAAVAALDLVRRYGRAWARALRRSTAGRELRRLGLGEDVTAAAAADSETVVPVYDGQCITVPGEKTG